MQIKETEFKKIIELLKLSRLSPEAQENILMKAKELSAIEAEEFIQGLKDIF